LLKALDLQTIDAAERGLDVSYEMVGRRVMFDRRPHGVLCHRRCDGWTVVPGLCRAGPRAHLAHGRHRLHGELARYPETPGPAWTPSRRGQGTSADGTTIKFYADAEAVLARLPRRGVPLILKARRRGGGVDPFRPNHMAKLVRRLADEFGLPETFTLDACRHGGMTELEEAELTTGQGRALSGHRTDRAYSGYAKATLERALPATRKRYAHRIANEQGTSVQNDNVFAVQNDARNDDDAIA
jgi:hypothetical protein